MVVFRDLAKSAKKFTDSGASASTTYVANAAAAGQHWQDNTVASEANYVTGVQQAASRGAFGKGVAKAGAAKYIKQINAVAGARFTDGIAKAGPAWATSFGAIATQVANTQLTPRGPRGSQANKDRARQMGEAFRAAKVGAAA